MKNIQKMSLLAFTFMMFQQIHGSDSQNSEALEFPEHTTEKYIYNKSVDTENQNSFYRAIFGKHPNGINITDTTYEDLLSNRVTRKKIETKTENGVSIITTETWNSRNPSYITWVNGALVISTIAAIALGAAGINAFGNMSAAGVNAFGNMGGKYLEGLGNAGNAMLQTDNPEVKKFITQIAAHANKTLESMPQ